MNAPSDPISLVDPLIPPAASILFDVVEFEDAGSCVAVNSRLPFERLPVEAQEPLVGLNSSQLVRPVVPLVELRPPAASA